MNESTLKQAAIHLRERWSNLARNASGALLLVSGVCYVSTFTSSWPYLSDATLICLFGLLMFFGGCRLLINGASVVMKSRADGIIQTKALTIGSTRLGFVWFGQAAFLALLITGLGSMSLHHVDISL